MTAMPIMLNSLLTQIELEPANVILLRNQDKRAAPGRTPYELWRDNRPAFERYQSTQNIRNRQKLSRASVWASFVGTFDGATMFVGMYATKYNGLLAEGTPWPHADGIDLAGSCDVVDWPTWKENFSSNGAKGHDLGCNALIGRIRQSLNCAPS